MANKWKKIAAVATTIVMASSVAAGLAGCRGGEDGVTYNKYTSAMPSDWNMMTYRDNNDTQIIDYVNSALFEFDYLFDENKGGKFRADGTINTDAIVSGGYSVKYSAATALEDVTASVDAKYGYTPEQKTAGGYAWKITLRNDLKWDDGTPIKADDFIYSMQEQLNPDFKNFRANSYYSGTNALVNAGYYFNKNIPETYESVASRGYASNADALKAGETLYLDMWNFFGLEGAKTPDGTKECPQWVDVTDTTLYVDPADNSEWSAAAIFATYGTYLEVGADDAGCIGIKVQNTHTDIQFSDVGFYKAGEYEIVMCLVNPLYPLNSDGSLNYRAAYNMSSLPLVKKDLYESCKKDPQAGSTLKWTNYDTTLATSASWGPYKLTEFQSGKAYTLEKNEHWYGYGLDDNKDQYKVETIKCEAIPETSTQWMGFFNGTLDTVSIDVTHKDDYRDSRYTYFTPGTGTFSLNLYAGLDVLKKSGRNNGLLAIDEFRKAVSLAIDRADYNAETTTAMQPAYGIVNTMYYYDIDNGGVYRDTVYAKKGLLRAYGFTELDGGKWSDGTHEYNTLEAAYEALNGYNPTLAKQLVNEAYAKLTANADYYGYDAGKNIEFIYGTQVDNPNTRRDYDYIVRVFENLVKDTPLEGKITITFDSSTGNKWADDFRAGAYEIASGTGFGGNPLNPASFIGLYLDPEWMYSSWWDTETETITFTMPDGDYAGAGAEYTMTLMNLSRCLEGLAENKDQYKFNWGPGAIPEEARLQLMAMIEELVISKYYSIPTTYQYSATMLGMQFSYLTEDYNYFMSYGGMQYMRVNYTDKEWKNYSSKHNLEAEYKKSAE